MSKPVRNKITSGNYQKMWCKHMLGLAFNFNKFAATNVAGDGSTRKCVGERCPDLMFIDRDEDNWVGYCGATRK